MSQRDVDNSFFCYVYKNNRKHNKRSIVNNGMTKIFFLRSSVLYKHGHLNLMTLLSDITVAKRHNLNCKSKKVNIEASEILIS